MAIRDRNTLKGYYITGAQPTQTQFGDLIDSVFLKGDSVPLANVSYGINPLTYATTTTWDMSAAGTNCTLTLTGNTTLSVTNMQAGQFALLVVKQDSTGSRTLALPSGSKVVNTGGGVAVLSPGANSIDILSVFYDGTNYYWLVNQSFT